MPAETTWYFAYGSNLWIDQIIDRIEAPDLAARGPRIARLEGWRLVFQPLTEGGPGYGNILPGGDGVTGVVYPCTEEELQKMDRFETHYARRPIQVQGLDGAPIAAVSYFVDPPTEVAAPPTDAYLGRIVGGARRHALPEAYIESVIAAARSAALPPD